jgi:hypothetical protein
MSGDAWTTHRPEAETAAVLDDIRIAEAQIARGESIDHDAAEQVVLARLRTSTLTTEPR